MGKLADISYLWLLIFSLLVNLGFGLSTTDLLPSYDFIVVGAGTAGLTVADRLSENGTFTVLVIEYGYNDTSSSIRSINDTASPGLFDFPPDPDATPDQFPIATRMYNLTSIEPALNNRTQGVLAGSVVGGSSAVNGMFFDRGSKEDYDAWVLATGNSSAEYGAIWGWDNLLPSFKKSVTFQPPTLEMREKWNVTADTPAAYLETGVTDIDSCYPPYQWPGVLAARKTLATVPGVKFPTEGADGAVGVFWVPNSVVPNARERSYAASGHYLNEGGPVTRSNFHLLPAHRVTQVLLSKIDSSDGKETLWRADEVVISPRDGPLPRKLPRIKATREVILSAGTLHTPQILQRSGIGAPGVLEAANVSVKVNLPGVGQNLQDHAWALFIYEYTTPVLPIRNTLITNATFRDEATELWNLDKTGPYSNLVSHGGWLPLPVISKRIQALTESLLAQDPASFFPPGTDPSVIAGYEVRRKVSAQQLLGNASAVVEILWDGDSIGPLIFLKPQSRGTILLSPEDDGSARGEMEPSFIYNTLQNPIDVQIFLAIIRFWRAFHASPIMQATFAPVEISPGADVVSDQDLIAYLRDNVLSTNGHMVGTAALGPVELGGVTRPDLTVHGTVGLSIADNSVIPLIPGTHTSSTAYAIGEKASLLILARHS